MSEEKAIIHRAAGGRFAPGFSASPGGRINNYQKELVEAVRNEYPPAVVLSMMRTCWEMATEGPSASPKAAISFMKDLLDRLGGRPPTQHVRINTNFEDMLSMLGKDEPVTIDATQSE